MENPRLTIPFIRWLVWLGTYAKHKTKIRACMNHSHQLMGAAVLGRYHDYLERGDFDIKASGPLDTSIIIRKSQRIKTLVKNAYREIGFKRCATHQNPLFCSVNPFISSTLYLTRRNLPCWQNCST